MKVRDFAKKLLDYNPDAEFRIIAFCAPHNFTITYGDREGVEKHNCENVDLYVDELCATEQVKTNPPRR